MWPNEEIANLLFVYLIQLEYSHSILECAHSIVMEIFVTVL